MSEMAELYQEIGKEMAELKSDNSVPDQVRKSWHEALVWVQFQIQSQLDMTHEEMIEEFEAVEEINEEDLKEKTGEAE